MKVEIWLKEAGDKLKASGLATANLDSLVLLEDELKKDRAHLLAHPETTLKAQSLQRLEKQINMRAKHQPLSYIRGKTEFYGREFIINEHVLEPRPESETIIEQLKALKLPEKPIILDLGTGSGALAITAKLELPKARVLASDIDKACLALAENNARKHKAAIELIQGDLMLPLTEQKMDVILANLPYVPDKFKLNESAMNEPRLAIFGGSDGLDVYRRLFRQLASYGFEPESMLTESLPYQHQKLVKIAQVAGYKLTKTDDFIQLFKPVT